MEESLYISIYERSQTIRKPKSYYISGKKNEKENGEKSMLPDLMFSGSSPKLTDELTKEDEEANRDGICYVTPPPPPTEFWVQGIKEKPLSWQQHGAAALVHGAQNATGAQFFFSSSPIRCFTVWRSARLTGGFFQCLFNGGNIPAIK